MPHWNNSSKVSYLDSLSSQAVSWEDVKYIAQKACTPPTVVMRSFKALLDSVAVLCALPLMVPIFLFIAMAIKLDSKGSVFFTQTRTGLNGEPFRIYKFRTMVEAAGQDSSKVEQSKQNDLRHTKVGRFLRRTSLDELPQLINVLKGEMSLVGPRPHAKYHDKLFMSSVPGYARRFRVRPGMTGLAQVSGYRGIIENAEHIKTRTNMDNEYIDQWSAAKEIKILFKTVLVVIQGINAH